MQFKCTKQIKLTVRILNVNQLDVWVILNTLVRNKLNSYKDKRLNYVKTYAYFIAAWRNYKE